MATVRLDVEEVGVAMVALMDYEQHLIGELQRAPEFHRVELQRRLEKAKTAKEKMLLATGE
jgi:hypothetical protein